jgi:endonuclease/exonuclease/phosphatase family metal-dependent hydrolase
MTRAELVSAAVVLAAAACNDPRGAANPAALSGDVPVTAVTYNVYGPGTLEREPEKGEAIAAQLAGLAPDLIGVNECDGCGRLVDLLPAHYELVSDATIRGVGIIFDSRRWRLDDHGHLTLGSNDDGWGERVAVWARFAHVETGGALLFYATHWCLATRSPDDTCDSARHLAYADTVLDHADGRLPSNLPVILTGDLNVGEEGGGGQVLASLAERGLIDAVRAVYPVGDIFTYMGNEIAPPARADYIFVSSPAEIVEAYVDRETVPEGAGSDHWPVIATVRYR